MPYSDNLYSMVDDDDSDLQEEEEEEEEYPPIDHDVLNQLHHVRQNLPYGDGDEAHAHVPVDGHDHGLYNVDIGVDNSVDADNDDDVFSPTDGYFRAAPETGTTSSGASHWHTTTDTPSYHPQPPPPLHTGLDPVVSAVSNTAPQAQQAPHVPNVWVQDPSLQPGSTAESKAREADQERLANTRQRRLSNSDDVDSTAGDSTFHSVQRNNNSYLDTAPYTSTSSHHAASSSSSAAIGSRYPGQDAYPYSYHYQPSSSSSSYHTSYTPYTRPRHQQPPYYNNFNSQFYPTPNEAPPAYTPSPTSPTSSSSSPNSSDPSSRNYRTFTNNIYHTTNTSGTMGGREETEGLLARDPESMGGPTDDNHQQTSVWGERMRRRLPYLNWRSGKVLLGGLLLLLVTIGFLTSLISGFEDGTSNPDKNLPPPPPPKSPSTKDPSNDPNKPPMDHQPPSNNKPPPLHPPNDDGFQWRSGWNCQTNKIARPTEQFNVHFTPDKFLAIVQETAQDEPRTPAHLRNVQVQGDVIFRKSTSDSNKPSSGIVLEVSVSDDRINLFTLWDSTSQTLVVTVPGNIPWDSYSSPSSSEGGPGPCVNIQITVYVPASNATLNNLSVSTIHLGINLIDDLSLEISKDTRLQSTVGQIISAAATANLPSHNNNNNNEEQIFDIGAPDTYYKFRSRIIEARTTSASIKGTWPLLDYLGLISTSGNIKALIEPQPNFNSEQPAPATATLYIKSYSGDVEFKEPIHAAQDAFTVSQAWKEAGREEELLSLGGDFLTPEMVLPPRDYRVDVHTTSGNIKGAVAFGSLARFRSTSGDMVLDLLPVLDSSYVTGGSGNGNGGAGGGMSSNLVTSSTSGNSVVYLGDALWVGRDFDSDSVGLRYIPFPFTGTGNETPGVVQPDSGKGKGKEQDNPTVIIAGTQKTGQAARQAAALRCINSQHTLTSGDMKLHYPSTWEGELSLATNSGRLTAVGDGVEVIKSGKGGGGGGPGGSYGKYILAKKGDLGGGGGGGGGEPGRYSRFVARTTSGDVLLTVGG